MSDWETVRRAVARWLSLVAVALLCYGGMTLAFAWWQASRDGKMPEHWGEHHGNHGPWRHYYVGREVLGRAIAAAFWACCAAGLSLAAAPKAKTALLTSLCIASLLALSYTHFWLID